MGSNGFEWYMMVHDHALVKALTAALRHTLTYPECLTSHVLMEKSEMFWDILNDTVFRVQHLFVTQFSTSILFSLQEREAFQSTSHQIQGYVVKF